MLRDDNVLPFHFDVAARREPGRKIGMRVIWEDPEDTPLERPVLFVVTICADRLRRVSASSKLRDDLPGAIGVTTKSGKPSVRRLGKRSVQPTKELHNGSNGTMSTR